MFKFFTKIAKWFENAEYGAQLPPNLPGTLNFSHAEFKSKDGSPTPEGYYSNIQSLMEALETIRAYLGGKSIKIISGYRSKYHNSKIGGVRKSQHLTGRAADIRVPGIPPHKVADAIQELMEGGHIPRGGIGRYNTFTHYDIRGRVARWDKTGE